MAEVTAIRLADAPTAAQQEQLKNINADIEPKFGVSIRYEWRKTFFGYDWYIVVTRSGERPKIGRPPKELPPAKVIRQRHSQGSSMAALAHEYGVTRATLYRHLANGCKKGNS